MIVTETVLKLAKHPVIIAAAKNSGEDAASLAQQLFFAPSEKKLKDGKSGIGIMTDAVEANVVNVERNGPAIAFYAIDNPDDETSPGGVVFVNGNLTCWK